MQRGALIIPVRHLTDEPFTLDLRCTAETLELPGFFGEIVVEASIRRVDQRLLLHCNIRGTAEALCDRCAEPFTGEYATEFDQWYIADSHRESEDDNDGEDDAIRIAPEKRSVVIDTAVRENMMIALPMKRLCREDCLGLCPVCGRNRNVDPCTCDDERDNPLWAGLRSAGQ